LDFDAFPASVAWSISVLLGEWKAGKQSRCTAIFFKLLADLLPVGWKVLHAKPCLCQHMIDFQGYDSNAKGIWQAHVMALMSGISCSCFPTAQKWSSEIRTSFKLILKKGSGRLDYIETIGQWRKKFEVMLEKVLALCHVAASVP